MVQLLRAGAPGTAPGKESETFCRNGPEVASHKRFPTPFPAKSVADRKKILAAARKAIRAQQEGNQVVVVVSAMGHNTDLLIELANEITERPPAREMDMLLSTGEQVSVALMGMAIESLGSKAHRILVGYRAEAEGVSVDQVAAAGRDADYDAPNGAGDGPAGTNPPDETPERDSRGGSIAPSHPSGS